MSEKGLKAVFNRQDTLGGGWTSVLGTVPQNWGAWPSCALEEGAAPGGVVFTALQACTSYRLAQALHLAHRCAQRRARAARASRHLACPS